MTNEEPDNQDVPPPQRRSGAAAGMVVIGIALVVVIGIFVLWDSPWADDSDPDPSRPGFQEDPSPGAITEDDEAWDDERFGTPDVGDE